MSSITGKRSPRDVRARCAGTRASLKLTWGAGHGWKMLKVSDVHVYYGAIHALKGVSFSVEKGELITLLGANGAGKTTTLKTLSGLLRPERGSVELEGNGLHKVDAHEIVHRGVAHVPEGRKVFPRFTVLENLKIGGYARDNSALAPELDFVFQ